MSEPSKRDASNPPAAPTAREIPPAGPEIAKVAAGLAPIVAPVSERRDLIAAPVSTSTHDVRAASTQDVRAAQTQTTAGSTSSRIRVRPQSNKAWLMLGGGIALAGVLLAIASHLPISALAPMRAFQVHSVTLIVGGLFVFTIGAARQSLTAVRQSLESVSKETARLEQVSVRGLELRVAFDQFSGDQAALKKDVLELQAQLKSLMDMAADPEQTVANFRLAASVDQLGMRLDTFIKEQFRITQQHLTEVVQHTEHASRSLATRLDEVSELVVEQHQAQQVALREAIEPLQTVAAHTHGAVDQGLQTTARIEARLQSHQSSLANGFDSIAEGLQLVRSELSGGVIELRSSLDGVQQRVAEAIDHTDHAGRTLGSRIDEVEQLAAQQHQTQQVALREATELLQAASSKAQAGVEQSLESTAHLDAKVQGYHNSVTKRFDSIAEGLRLAASETGAGLKDLRASVDREFKQHNALLDVRFTSIDGRFDRSDRDRASFAKQLTDSFEQQIAARVEDLKKRLNAVAEDTQRGNKRVVTDLEQLAASVERHSLEQSAAVSSALNPLSESFSAANRELVDVITRLGAHFDETAEIQQSMTEDDRAALQGLGARIEGLFAHMDQQFAEQLQVVQSSLHEAVRDNAPDSAELRTNLEQIRGSINHTLDSRLGALERINLCVNELAAAFDIPGHAATPAPAAVVAVESESEAVVAQTADSELPPEIELG
jgi:hypothetical protein